MPNTFRLITFSLIWTGIEFLGLWSRWPIQAIFLNAGAALYERRQSFSLRTRRRSETAATEVPFLRCAAHVLIEPIDGACPGLLCCGFVVTRRRRIVVEAVACARIKVSLVRNVRGLEGCFVGRPCFSKPCVRGSVMDKNGRLDLRNVCGSRSPSVVGNYSCDLIPRVKHSKQPYRSRPASPSVGTRLMMSFSFSRHEWSMMRSPTCRLKSFLVVNGFTKNTGSSYLTMCSRVFGSARRNRSVIFSLSLCS